MLDALEQFNSSQTSQTHQQMCHKNVYKTSLKLDFRPILDAYNLLGYGETLSEKPGQVKQIENVRKTSFSGRIVMPTISWDTGKHFLKNQGN